MWKALWQKWTIDKPAAFGEMLWDVLVVQFAAFLDKLTLRRIIALIPVVVVILATVLAACGKAAVYDRRSCETGRRKRACICSVLDNHVGLIGVDQIDRLLAGAHSRIENGGHADALLSEWLLSVNYNVRWCEVKPNGRR